MIPKVRNLHLGGKKRGTREVSEAERDSGGAHGLVPSAAGAPEKESLEPQWP